MSEDTQLVEDLLDWYDRSARDLPWRAPGIDAWSVLVSEVMLQQTPVARVHPVWMAWMSRWPTPAALAAASPADVLRAWGKLGYPRRALRLHQCAAAIVERFGGVVPVEVENLESLPGVGTYTARAVAVFAHGRRHPVVDTNVRRVIARVRDGQGEAGPPSTRRDLEAVAALLPADERRAARLSIALMELGALVCTARVPRCAECPVESSCAWRRAGSPAYAGQRVRPQKFAGTDRQVRGLLMDVLRAADGPVPKAALDLVWPDAVQRERALDSLVVDGLVDVPTDRTYALPT